MAGPVNEGHACDAAVPTAASRREGMFDHAVLNLHYDLDAGEKLFRALGFNVTPRSFHTLGSMNNLIVFGTNYLELIGLDPSNPNPRKELLDWPVGLNGLVYGSDDIDVTAARLRSGRLPVLEPKAFSREVVIEGVADEARFRTVHLEPGYFAASRLYFCEHQTPHLVWHPAFMSHPNSARSLKRLAIVTDDVDAQAQSLTRVLGLRPDPDARVWSRGTRIDFVSRKRLNNLYHGHADPGSGVAKVAVMSICVASIAALKAAMEPRLAEKLVDIDKSCSLLPASECFGVAIEFLATNMSLV
jgi:hypothetical protein